MSLVLYPVFVHLYLECIYKGYEKEGIYYFVFIFKGKLFDYIYKHKTIQYLYL